MTEKIRILLVEDSEDDAMLIQRAIRKSGCEPDFQRVQTREEMESALGDGPWDIVLSDYSMPRFNGLSALEILNRSGQDIPFILVSGAVGEETAVDAMRNGAADFVMKDNLTRLVPAIERELREAQGRRERLRERKEREALEAQLRQAQKMEAIGTLAGGIAHDLNNILTPILGYAELARDQAGNQRGLRNQLDEIYNAGLRARDLVQQILAFSRQAGQELQPLRIQPLVKEAMKLLRAAIPATIEIVEAIDPACGPTLADPTHIHQIIMNLCTNAYQAMSATGGTLGVSLSETELRPEDLEKKPDLQPGRYVVMEVSDTGCGMVPEVLERIFEPYFTTKEQGKGTGLGLAVVYGILKRYKGDITVYSEPDKGTTFRLYFPRIEGRVRVQLDDGKAGETLPTGTENVLIVDDEEVIVGMEKQMLSMLGYNVMAFTSAEDALEAFWRDPESVDLVITDQTMPKITGAELARKILSLRPEVPIILCTGFSELINESVARENGIHGFLTKPIHVMDLARMLRRLLDGS